MPIRPAAAADFEAIAAITNHYITTSTIHFGYEPVTAPELQQLWQGSGGRFPWLVTEEDGQVLGYAKAGTWRERKAYSWTVETGLYVADQARGRGLGKALYVELLDELARRGFHSVVAGVTLPNPASVALHEALGFVSVGVVREAGWKFERWNDVAFFQKALTTAGMPPPT
jgi:phosphinothricin acetyltransferase